MKKFVCGVAVLLIGAAEACGGQPSNLLIGTWKLDKTGAAQSPSCPTPMTFTEKTRTMPDVNGISNTAAASYAAGDPTKFPAVVWLITDAGVANHTTFYFSSKSLMVMQTPFMCRYVRQ